MMSNVKAPCSQLYDQAGLKDKQFAKQLQKQTTANLKNSHLSTEQKVKATKTLFSIQNLQAKGAITQAVAFWGIALLNYALQEDTDTDMVKKANETLSKFVESDPQIEKMRAKLSYDDSINALGDKNPARSKYGPPKLYYPISQKASDELADTIAPFLSNLGGNQGAFDPIHHPLLLRDAMERAFLAEEEIKDDYNQGSGNGQFPMTEEHARERADPNYDKRAATLIEKVMHKFGENDGLAMLRNVYSDEQLDNAFKYQVVDTSVKKILENPSEFTIKGIKAKINNEGQLSVWTGRAYSLLGPAVTIATQYPLIGATIVGVAGLGKYAYDQGWFSKIGNSIKTFAMNTLNFRKQPTSVDIENRINVSRQNAQGSHLWSHAYMKGKGFARDNAGSIVSTKSQPAGPSSNASSFKTSNASINSINSLLTQKGPAKFMGKVPHFKPDASRIRERQRIIKNLHSKNMDLIADSAKSIVNGAHIDPRKASQLLKTGVKTVRNEKQLREDLGAINQLLELQSTEAFENPNPKQLKELKFHIQQLENDLKRDTKKYVQQVNKVKHHHQQLNSNVVRFHQKKSKFQQQMHTNSRSSTASNSFKIQHNQRAGAKERFEKELRDKIYSTQKRTKRVNDSTEEIFKELFGDLQRNKILEPIEEESKQITIDDEIANKDTVRFGDLRPTQVQEQAVSGPILKQGLNDADGTSNDRKSHLNINANNQGQDRQGERDLDDQVNDDAQHSKFSEAFQNIIRHTLFSNAIHQTVTTVAQDKDKDYLTVFKKGIQNFNKENKGRDIDFIQPNGYITKYNANVNLTVARQQLERRLQIFSNQVDQFTENRSLISKGFEKFGISSYKGSLKTQAEKDLRTRYYKTIKAVQDYASNNSRLDFMPDKAILQQAHNLVAQMKQKANQAADVLYNDPFINAAYSRRNRAAQQELKKAAIAYFSNENTKEYVKSMIADVAKELPEDFRDAILSEEQQNELVDHTVQAANAFVQNNTTMATLVSDQHKMQAKELQAMDSQLQAQQQKEEGGQGGEEEEEGNEDVEMNNNDVVNEPPAQQQTQQQEQQQELPVDDIDLNISVINPSDQQQLEDALQRNNETTIQQNVKQDLNALEQNVTEATQAEHTQLYPSLDSNINGNQQQFNYSLQQQEEQEPQIQPWTPPAITTTTNYSNQQQQQTPESKLYTNVQNPIVYPPDAPVQQKEEEKELAQDPQIDEQVQDALPNVHDLTEDQFQDLNKTLNDPSYYNAYESLYYYNLENPRKLLKEDYLRYNASNGRVGNNLRAQYPSFEDYAKDINDTRRARQRQEQLKQQRMQQRQQEF